MIPALALGLVLFAAPALADSGAVETSAGPALVVGDRSEDGAVLRLGDRVAFRAGPYETLWIERKVGALLLLGVGSGGTACPAEFLWLHSEDPGLRTSERFGTCSDLPEVSHDAETVTVSMPSPDAAEGVVDFVYDGKGPVRRVVRGAQPSGVAPAEGAEAWIGLYPGDLVRGSDWEAPLVALMGEKGWRAAQAAIEVSSPMEAEGDWVAGGGFRQSSGGDVAGAIAISRTDGRLLVALRMGAGAAPQLWGDPRGPLPSALAEVMGR